MSRVGCSAGKSGDLARKTSGGAKDELPVCRYARAIFEHLTVGRDLLEVEI